MEFNEKLQELRRQKGLTQEELANALYVSRTAVSKWELGKGLPSLESLKAISKLFSVTIDQLLSGDELITIAEQDRKTNENKICDLMFGILDISSLLLFFLPFFAQRVAGVSLAVSLIDLTAVSPYLIISYYILIISLVIFGVLTLALQQVSCLFWNRIKRKISLILNILAVILLVLSLQPYATIFLIIFFVIKVFLVIRHD